MSEATKYCKGCGYDLPRHSFARDKSNASGLNSKCRDCKREYKLDWQKQNPGYNSASCKKIRANNPEKRRANRAIEYGLRKGTITRLPCSVCGSKSSEAHHEDYSKPLDVIWYCRRHHHDRHEELRKIARTNGN